MRANGSSGCGISRGWPLLAVVIVPIILLVAWRAETPPVNAGGPAVSSAPGVQNAPLRETRPTLDPARFVGKARLAHQVARDIPGVLDQIYCYCQCDRHVGHKSLLSCYTDGHAAT